MMAPRVTIQLRGGTGAQWASRNTILALREPGLEQDTFRFKVGDGITRWNDLPYYMPADPTEWEHLAQIVAEYMTANPPPAGPKGEDATDEQVAANVASYLAQNPPAKGDKGEPGQSVKGDKGDPGASIKGDAGPSGATLVGTATITETALSLALLGGVRKVNVPFAAAVVGANYLLFPSAATPAGYAIADVVCLTAGTLQVSMTAPALGLLASYSIPVRVVRINT